LNNPPKIILLTDILDTRLRKEQELAFYQRELEKLQEKMMFLRKDIQITNLCIEIIEKEKVVDVREKMYDALEKPQSD
tara:strand:+ start:175 stop:408 length:234 start_codon:yes stop_codon:yes gene_type:complete